MEPLLTDFLGKRRRERLFQEHKASMSPRFHALADIVTTLRKTFFGHFPLPYDFALLPAIRETVSAAQDKKLTAASFDELSIPDIVADWKAQATSNLVKEINLSITGALPHDTNLGSLALGTLYFCSLCGESRSSGDSEFRTYPAVLSDRCNPQRWRSQAREEKKLTDDSYENVARDALLARGHVFEPWIFKTAQNIIESLGHNSLSVSAKALDDLDYRLVCTTEGCKSDDHHSGVQAVYTWRSAVSGLSSPRCPGMTLTEGFFIIAPPCTTD